MFSDSGNQASAGDAGDGSSSPITGPQSTSEQKSVRFDIGDAVIIDPCGEEVGPRDRTTLWGIVNGVFPDEREYEILVYAEASETPESLQTGVQVNDYGARSVVTQWRKFRKSPADSVIVPEDHLILDNRDEGGPDENETGMMEVL